MKRAISLLTIMVLLLCAALPAFAMETTEFVYDLAGILTSYEVEQLRASAASISAQYQCGIYIVVMEDMADFGYHNIEKFAEAVYDSWELGYDAEGTGIVLILSMAERDYDLDAFGERAHRAFTDYGKEALADTFLDDFKRNDWAAGFYDYIENAGALLDRASRGDPLDRPGYAGPAFHYERSLAQRVRRAFLPGLAVGLLFALIYCSVLKSKMKSAKEATQADDYVPQQGVNIYIHDDRFSHTTQVRERIESDSGSRGGSGGGTHISVGGHSHSSGKF